ncbi:DUF5915 domain-containing protein, partial [Borreliella garinii]
VSDRINLYIENNATLEEILNKFEKYIKTETLALNIILNKSKLEKKISLDDDIFTIIGIEKC